MESNSSVSSALGQLARIFSWVLHPFVLAGPTLWYATYATTGDILQSIAWSAVFIVIVPLITFVAFQLRRGQYANFGVSAREHCFGLFVFSGSCFILAWVFFVILGAPRILELCFLAALLALAIGALVTTKTKASIHAGVGAGCAIALFSLSPLIGLLAGVEIDSDYKNTDRVTCDHAACRSTDAILYLIRDMSRCTRGRSCSRLAG